MRPIEMLLNELKLLKRCKEKSIASFNKNDIDLNTHETHLKNLNPLINEFETTINILKNENNF